ncbi:MAG: ABC-F family ATP-binding cassette domain-containing protein [Bacteroidales bacterium]|nr:ABC-F family ATP-binding cassette domain-containing protein [Bacteroidales bacterium]
MISINNLSVHFTGEFLFKNVSFNIREKDRIGLVGKNGTGKTTILNIIAGIQKPETGEIILPSGQTTAYLPQEMKVSSRKTVYNEALTAFVEILNVKKQIKKYSDELALRTDFESDEYLNIVNKHSEESEKFRIIGGLTIQADTERILGGLGFTRDDFDRPLQQFSNGWQMRVELAKILLRKPDLLLLDEPTNHLDIVSIQWLEGFLIKYRGAIILVSHDRAFLDNITSRTIEISGKKIFDYKGGYSDYILKRQQRLEQQKATFNNQQKEIRQIERFVERFRYKSTKAKQVQSRVKMLEKMDEIEIDEIDNSSIHFKFPPAPHSGKIVINTKDISKNFGSKNIINSIDFLAVKGEKIAFVGRNGEGKSTMSKIFVGELDYNGELKIGHNVKIGYYAQNQWEMLDPDKTVFETIDDVAIGDIRAKIRGLLGSFLFSEEDIEKKVKVLSGGEKSRLSLAKLLLTPVNMLILDEPTNHLDMQSKDILKNALLKFDGTLIIVSHDRDFLQGLTNKVYEFKNKNIKEYPGDIYDYLNSRNLESLKELEVFAKEKTSFVKKNNKTDNKIKWEQNKELDKKLRKVKRQIENSESTIEKLENEIVEIDSFLSNPIKNNEMLSSGEVYKNYNELKSRLSSEMNKWEDLQIELEGLEEK